MCLTSHRIQWYRCKCLFADVEYFVEPDKAQVHDWYEGQVHHFLQGVAYPREGAIVKVSFRVLPAYALAAIIFTVHEVIVRCSSHEWQSI